LGVVVQEDNFADAVGGKSRLVSDGVTYDFFATASSEEEERKKK
jgi:hypothetical protein